MDILAQIQIDLMDQKKPLSAILREAKVLASQIGSDELATWVGQELDGYKDVKDLPDYRFLHTSVAGTWTNGYWVVQNRITPLSSIKNGDLRKMLTTFPVVGGIRTVEQFAEMKDGEQIMVPADATAFVNTQVGQGGYGYAELHYTLGPHNFEQILDTVRNRLLDFVLKLVKQWNPKTEPPPAQDEISRLVSVVIYNVPQGGSMSVFDQRGQQVEYQFNAAGDIKIEAIQSLGQLGKEIAKLRVEIDEAKRLGAVPEDTGVEAQYHLLKASREAESRKPDKSILLGSIGKARDLLKDITALAGLVSTLVNLADVVTKLIR